MTKKKKHLTDAVHGGEPERFDSDSITPPVVQTSTYAFEDTAALRAYMSGETQREEYGRYGNPTVKAVEARVAHLEGAESALLFATGMAALTTTILAILKADAHVVLFDDCYRRTRQFVVGILGRFGVEHTLVPAGDLRALNAAITDRTRLVVTEAPTNPYLRVADLPELTSLCREKRVKTLVDATFATPVNMRPLEFGADLVAHSATKYFGGHNDVLGGTVAGSHALVSLVAEMRDVLGGTCDPHAAFLIGRGLKTLALRVAQQNASALAMAEMLSKHPAVACVHYPGLKSHVDHAVAKRIMSGYGGVVSFELRGDLDSTSRFIDALRIPKIAPSLGGVESLVEQPALMSFFELSTTEREAIGIRDTLVRYAVGIEDGGELIADVERALDVL